MDRIVKESVLASGAEVSTVAEEDKKRGTFSRAFSMQNIPVESAIKSLDHLNEQVLQFIFSPAHTLHTGDHRLLHKDHDNQLSAKDRETLKTSMILMRHLLVDAQTKFRKMVDENQRLAARIDGSIHAASQEVNVLRAELVETNRRLSAMGEAEEENQDGGSHIHDDSVATIDMQQTHSPTTKKSASVPAIHSKEEVRELDHLREENRVLRDEIASLRGDMTELRRYRATDAHTTDWKLEFIQTKQELSKSKEAVQALKADRKRLKAEKVELLGQMKQLYMTLEDKEGELRDFIRNYEQRMKDNEENIKQLVEEKEASERAKWEILKKAQSAAERCVQLQTESDNKTQTIQQLQQKIAEELPLTPDRAVSLHNSIPNLSSNTNISQASSTQKLSSNRLSSSSICQQNGGSLEHLKPLAEEDRPSSLNTSEDTTDNHTPTNSIRTKRDLGGVYVTISADAVAPNPTTANTSIQSNQSNQSRLSNSSNVLNPLGTGINYKPIQRKKAGRQSQASQKSPGTFSKLFGGNKTKVRTSIAVTDNMVEEYQETSTPRISMLTQDNYQEKLQLLGASKTLPVNKWKANHVLAWLEIDMSMPMYGAKCAENVKSGKVLLGLSDSELDSALGLTSTLHRRKLRLAIEEYRDPNTVKFPKAASVDHTWLAHRWMGDLGLEQYRDAVASQLLDGRLLNVLTRKDLEKHLGIHRKFHQMSLLHGVELLRRVNFDKEILARRRSECEERDTDLIVWSSQRVIKWLESIDLHEYVENIEDGGIHGAVIVLDPSFTPDTFATALGIPPAKSYVRRHLNTELDAIVRPARSLLDSKDGGSKKRSSSSSSVSKGFTRSYRGSSAGSEGDGIRGSGKRLSFRGSLGRALGRKIKPPPEISAPVLQDASQDNSNGKLDLKHRSNSDNVFPTTNNGTSTVV